MPCRTLGHAATLATVALSLALGCRGASDGTRDSVEEGSQSKAGVGAPPDATREDLARFVGEYGTPESDLQHRTFWVLVHCDGHLVAGAMWGDASPWHLERISEMVFVQRVVPEMGSPVRLEFDSGPAGGVEGLRVQYDGRPFLTDFPALQRLREIPRGTDGECLQTF